MKTMRYFMLIIAVAGMSIGCTVSGDRMLERYGWKTLDGDPPLVIAHRGNSHDFPEHSYYALSYAGHYADLIEVDIVLTKEGVPICQHDLFLSQATNIASLPEFADRKRTVGGRDDWWAMDLTRDEFKKLTAVQRHSHLPTHVNTALHIPTLAELFEIARETADKSGVYFRESHRPLGLLIEIKQPAAHRAAGYDVSRAVLDVIERQKKKGRLPPIYIQCFDRAEVTRLLGKTDLPIFLLSAKPVDPKTLPEGLAGLGLKKDLLKLRDGRSEVLEELHSHGLQVFCWTYRLTKLPVEENQEQGPNSPTAFRQMTDEITPYLLAGVDGVIADNPSWATMSRLDEIADPEGKHKEQGFNPLGHLAEWWFFNVRLRHRK